MRFRLYFLLVLLFLGVCACQRHETERSAWRQENGKIKVLTTIAMINDLVKEIGGDRVDTMALICGELDPHSYELVKGDDEKFARADLIFFNGLGLEHGLSLQQNLINNPKAVAVAEPILNESPTLVLIVDGCYDPHLWMDIALWMRTIDPIVNALVAKDPLHAEEYRERGSALRTKMEAADQEMYRILQAIDSKKRYLVTSHDAFHYFARHYLAEPGEEEWSLRCQAPEGLSPEAQMSVNDVIAIIAHIERFNISVLFPESNVSKDSLRKILDVGKEKGFEIRLCSEELYGDSMGKAASYLEMMSHNVETIAKELRK
jgi:manganese/zinc/iron transport system substrate-binding protein